MFVQQIYRIAGLEEGEVVLMEVGRAKVERWAERPASGIDALTRGTDFLERESDLTQS